MLCLYTYLFTTDEESDDITYVFFTIILEPEAVWCGLLFVHLKCMYCMYSCTSTVYSLCTYICTRTVHNIRIICTNIVHTVCIYVQILNICKCSSHIMVESYL